MLEYLLAKPNIAVRGLMTIVPFYDDPEAARGDFSEMNILFQKLKRSYAGFDFNVLSMGMSGDFSVAIEEGANVVRIGTALFGNLN